MFKYLISLLGGVLLSKSFDDNNWLLSVFALALLLWLLDRSTRRVRIWILLIFSATYFSLHLSWMKVIGPDAWILITALGVIPWVFLGLIEFRSKSLRSLIFFSLAVVTVELIRSHFPFGGFPWGLIAYSQVDGPLVEFARIGSSSLVTFMTVLLSGLLLRLFTKKALQSVVLFSIVLASTRFIQPVSATQEVSLVAIQGNVPRIGLELTAQRRAVLDNHLMVTKQFLSGMTETTRPELIVWPESSTDIDPLRDREVADQITDLVNTNNIPILVGATIQGSNPSGPRNAGILWLENGPNQIYIKNNLVPFGEYIPFRNLLTDYIDRIRLVPSDFIPGNQLGLFKVNEITFGDVICFEIAFGNYVRQVVNSGSDFLTVQTNNATYGLTQQPEQQFTITRFRAIEHKRSIIVASTSGISGAIDPNGNTLQKTDQFVPAVVEVKVPIVKDQSFSDKYPGWMSILSGLIVGFHVVRLAVRKQLTRNIS